MSPTYSCVKKHVEEQVWGINYWSELPEDLKVDILCRLLDKPLIRLKCVSKSWYFLISNRCVPKISSSIFCGLMSTYAAFPEGCALFLRFSCATSYYYIHKCQPRLLGGLTCFLDDSLPFKHKPEDFQDCCNGVLLLARYASSLVPTQYYVCNPATRECIIIPVNPDHVHQEEEKDSPRSAFLAFDPSNIDSPNSFKIIVPREYYHPYSIKLDVFSSGLGNWTSHIVSLDRALNGFKFIDRAIYVNGILYMLSLAKYLVCIYLTQDSRKISSRAIALPKKDEFDSCGNFGVSSGNLVYSNSDNSKIIVWLLQNGEHWALQHTINIDEFDANPQVHKWLYMNPDSGPIKVYAFHPNSEDIFVGNRILIYKYNPKTKKMSKYEHVPSDRNITGGQYRVFPLSRCGVILNNSVNRNQ